MNLYDLSTSLTHSIWIYRRLLQRTAELYGKQPGVEILDVGCATGSSYKRLWPYVEKHHMQVTGIDINGRFVELFNRQHANHQDRLRARCVDFFSHVPDRQYDVVIAAQVYQQFPSRVSFLRRTFESLLKPNGRCLINTTCWRRKSAGTAALDSIMRRLMAVTKGRYPARGLMTVDECLAEIRREGFWVSHVERVGVWWNPFFLVPAWHIEVARGS